MSFNRSMFIKNNLMETIDLIGLFGAFLSGVTFFPQVYRTWKLKSARDLSLTMILIILLSNVVWLIYAFEKQDVAIIAANFFVGCLLYTSPSPRDLDLSRMPSSA